MGLSGVLDLRATTQGTVIGLTSEALPIRIYPEPGWMTITCEPRLLFLRHRTTIVGCDLTFVLVGGLLQRELCLCGVHS